VKRSPERRLCTRSSSDQLGERLGFARWREDRVRCSKAVRVGWSTTGFAWYRPWLNSRTTSAGLRESGVGGDVYGSFRFGKSKFGWRLSNYPRHGLCIKNIPEFASLKHWQEGELPGCCLTIDSVGRIRSRRCEWRIPVDPAPVVCTQNPNRYASCKPGRRDCPCDLRRHFFVDHTLIVNPPTEINQYILNPTPGYD